MNNLTEIMIRDGIINIHMDPHGSFQLRMKGDILGTGRTVEEAYQNAMRDKLARTVSEAYQSAMRDKLA